MESAGSLSEPEFTYDLQTGGINTDKVQSFFGIQTGERGILQAQEIQPRVSHGINSSQDFTLDQLRVKIYNEIQGEPLVNSTVLSCYHCSTGNVFPIHPDVSRLLGNTINSTGRAADVIQTYISSAAFTVYHKGYNQGLEV